MYKFPYYYGIVHCGDMVMDAVDHKTGEYKHSHLLHAKYHIRKYCFCKYTGLYLKEPDIFASYNPTRC